MTSGVKSPPLFTHSLAFRSPPFVLLFVKLIPFLNVTSVGRRLGYLSELLLTLPHGFLGLIFRSDPSSIDFCNLFTHRGLFQLFQLLFDIFTFGKRPTWT